MRPFSLVGLLGVLRSCECRSATDDLEGAYALKSPEDSVNLYRTWAGTYESQWAADVGYAYPHAFSRRPGTWATVTWADRQAGRRVRVWCGAGQAGAAGTSGC